MVTSKVILASCLTQLEVYNDHSDNAHSDNAYSDNDHVNEPDIDLGTKSFAIVHFNSVRVGHFIMFPTYGAFSHDVTEAIFLFLNKEMVAKLVFQTSPVAVELFSNENAFFCPNKFELMSAT